MQLSNEYVFEYQLQLMVWIKFKIVQLLLVVYLLMSLIQSLCAFDEKNLQLIGHDQFKNGWFSFVFSKTNVDYHINRNEFNDFICKKFDKEWNLHHKKKDLELGKKYYKCQVKSRTVFFHACTYHIKLSFVCTIYVRCVKETISAKFQ